MTHVTDPNDPRLGHGGPDSESVDQHAAYLVLSADERAKGFVRPVRRSYRHSGIAVPEHPLRDLTADELARFGRMAYVKFEAYPPETSGSAVGRFWTQVELDAVGRGCGTITTMSVELAETYARQPGFYGATYCCGCRRHLAVGANGEFVWEGTEERVGT